MEPALTNIILVSYFNPNLVGREMYALRGQYNVSEHANCKLVGLRAIP